MVNAIALIGKHLSTASAFIVNCIPNFFRFANCPTLIVSHSRPSGGGSVKLYPINYRGHQEPKRSTKRMSHQRKARLRGALIRRLLLINAVLYVFAVLAALAGNSAVLLLPVGVTAMLVIAAIIEYLGDSWEDGMVSAAHLESQDRVSERELRKELRHKGQDPEKVEKRL